MKNPFQDPLNHSWKIWDKPSSFWYNC